MIAAPWDIVLTLVFAATAVCCLVMLLRDRRRAGAGVGLSDDAVVDINHLVMSAAMILIVWVVVGDAVTWAQVALFAVLAASLLPALVKARSVGDRVDVIGHIVLDAAMIWMLLAMPLLMAGPSSESGGGGQHHGGSGGVLLTATPMWVDVVNVVFIALATATAVWWTGSAIRRSRGHRVHLLCHALMGAGMALMLVLMNL